MSVIFEKWSSAFAASRARIAYAGDRKRKHSGLRVAPCSARIGAKLNRHFSFAGHRHFVGTASKNSCTGAVLQAKMAVKARQFLCLIRKNAGSAAALSPFRMRHPGKIKPIRRATVERGRSQPTDRGKTIDMHAFTQQVIGDVKHDHFANEDRICA